MAIEHGARFRQRKISIKQTLRVYPQNELPDIDSDVPRDIVSVETGVDKNEEDEEHLQAVLNASISSTSGSSDSKPTAVYIPTPDASKAWPEYKKYYTVGWASSESYVRSSATVEDAQGCPYNLTEQDEEFLVEVLNKDAEQKQKCSEDELEMMLHLFEKTIASKQPFLSTDPTKVFDYEELEKYVMEYVQQNENDPESLEKLLANVKDTIYAPEYTPSPFRTVAATFRQFGKRVYEYWRLRKIECNGRSILPTLKFEKDIEKDENDPYVCFRHREVRQQRKTRRTDQQSTNRLRRLQAEMYQAKKLFELISKREQTRLKSLQVNADLFDHQTKAKALKRKLSIAGDDEEFCTLLKKKKEPRVSTRKSAEDKEKGANGTGRAGAAAAAAAAAAGATSAGGSAGSSSSTGSAAAAAAALSGGAKLASSKIPDLEVYTLEQSIFDKDAARRAVIKAKLRSRQQADRGWNNFSDNPFIPWHDFFDPEQKAYAEAQAAKIDIDQAAYTSSAPLYRVLANDRLKLPVAVSLGKSYALRPYVDPKVLLVKLGKEGEPSKIVKQLSDRELTPNSDVSIPRFTTVTLRRRNDVNNTKFIDRRCLRPVPSFVETPETEADERLAYRFKYDVEPENERETLTSTFSDPSRINGISEETQNIRFGAMLSSKAYETFQEAQLLRQQQALSRQQKLQQQRQEAVNAAKAAEKADVEAVTSTPSSTGARATPTSAGAPASGASSPAKDSGPGVRLTNLPGWSSTTVFASNSQTQALKSRASSVQSPTALTPSNGAPAPPSNSSGSFRVQPPKIQSV